MYRIVYTAVAKHDIETIFNYIVNKFKNITAANNLLNEFSKEEKNIKIFPYSNPEYILIGKANYKYRKSVVKNYLIFYIVNEDSKTIIISRILYKKRNLEKSLN